MPRSDTRRCAISLAIAVCFVLCGCGGDDDPWTRAAVEGTVTLDGEPLKTGNITFFPGKGIDGPAAGAEIDDGEFSLPVEEGPVVGNNRVVIRSVQPTGRKVRYDGFLESDGPATEGQMVDEFRNMVPPQYNSRSTLDWEIEVDTLNKREFHLKTDPPKSG